MSNQAACRTGKVLVFGLSVLIIGFGITWLAGHGYLSLQPQIVAGATLVLFSIIFCLSVTTMMAGTDFIARQKIARLPDSPDDDIVSRVIRDSRNGLETIIQAHPNTSIREALEDDWPFEKKKSSDWYLVDEKGNDVTNWPISHWDGIAVSHYTS